MKSPHIEVLEIKSINNGNLKAFAKVKIGPLVICDFRVIQQPNQAAYVSAPQVQFEVNGQKRYKPMLDYPSAWKDAIHDAVIAAWDGGQ